jgi:hypothetical protein
MTCKQIINKYVCKLVVVLFQQNFGVIWELPTLHTLPTFDRWIGIIVT